MTISDVLQRQVKEILPNKKGLESLMRKKKIRLYLGVDPTGKNLHLGHTIALRKLQQFADLGHEAILVVGTGTVLAGDPSQRVSARARITPGEVAENIKTWKKQASLVLDFSKIKIRRNGEWLGKLQLSVILDIASHISASQLFQRDMFQERLKRGDTVWTHELLYPILQGYDSVHLDVDLEIGGTDQLFNMLVGRELQQKVRNREKYVLTVPMLSGLDGRPMSKTSGNTVNLTDEPADMYGKIMALRDSLVEHYFTLCTEVPLADIQGLPPREAKGRLAKEVVRLYHGENKAEAAAKEFERVFRHKQIPRDVATILGSRGPFSVLEAATKAGFASSKAEARRLIEQGGFRVAGRVERNPNALVRLKKGTIVQAGKRRFGKIG